MQLSPQWEYVSDQVMGGVSCGALRIEDGGDRPVAHLTGRVSLENNGGFIQMAFDLAEDAAGFEGIALEIRGNGQAYDVRLRTTDLTRPWQSFRTQVTATRDWQTHRLAFDVFSKHRTDAAFEARGLRRIGILGIGREFDVDIEVARVNLYA